MQEWQTIGRPGYLGKHRDEMFIGWTNQYGEGNWRLEWKVGKLFVGFLGVCALYEDAYFKFLGENPEVLEQLIVEASDVYDDESTNVRSVFDYMCQETGRTHIQDIAIRRVVLRMGLWFEGSELIRIRQGKGLHPLSITLSPGIVPFHRPDMIKQPELEGGWWRPGSVESFYQSNRFLQIKGGG